MACFARPMGLLLFILTRAPIVTIHAFPKFRNRSTNLKAQNAAMSSLGQKFNQVDDLNVKEMGLRKTESVISGVEALVKLSENARYTESPMLDRASFLQWALDITERKLLIDKEFKERVKVRELKRLHAVAICRLESAVQLSKDSYLLNENSALIIGLERAIMNCQHAAANMEKFLGLPSSMVATGVTDKKDRKESSINDSEESAVNAGSSTDIPSFDSLTIAENESATESAFGNIIGNIDILPDDKNSEKRRHVAAIYPLKLQELQKNVEEREKLLKSTPEYHEYVKCQEALEHFYEDVGLNAAEKHCLDVQKGAGNGRNSRGRCFEDTADSVITDHLLPLLAEANNCATDDLIVVRNLKLGMASNKGTTAELDSVICMKADRPARMHTVKPKGMFCKVLAVIEVKRNPDDVGSAFLGYQKSLAWLSGREELYDPADWKNKSYPKGHFRDRPFLHASKGDSIIFGPESFEGLRLKSVNMDLPSEFEKFKINRVMSEDEDCRNDSRGIEINESASDKLSIENRLDNERVTNAIRSSPCSLFVEDLYFVTKDGPLDSLHSKAMSWALNRISLDTVYDAELSDTNAVENLRLLLESRYPHLISTSDLICMYSSSNLTDQLFVVRDERNQI